VRLPRPPAPWHNGLLRRRASVTRPLPLQIAHESIDQAGFGGGVETAANALFSQLQSELRGVGFQFATCGLTGRFDFLQGEILPTPDGWIASNFRDRLWKGWIVPSADSDTWFAAGTTAYYDLLQSDDLEKALEARRIQYRGLKLAPGNAMNRFRIEETKGVLFLDSLRRKLGDDKFFPLLAAWFSENTTKTVSAKSFLDKAGVAFEFTEPADGPAYTVSDIGRRLGTAVLVYGTQREAGANRYAAEQLQAQYLNQFESQVPVYKDFEVNDELLAHKDVIFVGRPEANTALAAWAKQINLDYQAAVFKIENQTHAGEREALTYAAKNPLDPAHMVLVLAGNDALRTVKLATAGGRFEQTPYVITGEERPGANAMPGGRRPR